MAHDTLMVPAGVIQPRELLTWLIKARIVAEQSWQKAFDEDDIEKITYEGGRCDALTAVITHIQEG